MIGQSILVAEETCGTGRGRESIPNAVRKSRDATGLLPWHVGGWRRRRTQISVQRRRAHALVTDQLEVRSVPSTFANFSLSALASAVQPTVNSVPLLMQDVATPTVSANKSASIVLSLGVPGVSNIVTDLAGPLDDTLGAREGAAAAASGGGGSGGTGIGISVTAGARLVDLDTSVSVANQGIAITQHGLPVDVKVSLSPLEPIGGSSVPSPPSDSTPAPSPGNSTTLTSPAAPTSPTVERSPVSNSAAPTSEGGSTAGYLPSSASPGASASTSASDAPSTGSPAGNPVQAVGSAAGAQAAAFVPNAGLAAVAGLLEGSTAHEAASSTTGLSISALVSSLPGGETLAGQGVGGGEHNLEEPPSLRSERSTDPEIKPAELLPGDLESLERALAQLMRRFAEIGEDYGGLFAEFGVPELLFAAGMVGLAGEVFRRWASRRRLAIPRAQAGSSGRPGPFYRPRAYPFGRPGSGRLFDRPAPI
jgi:hypothetical protein